MAGSSSSDGLPCQRDDAPNLDLRAAIRDETLAAGYQLLEHTADVGLRAWGPTPPEAFPQAAWGLLPIMLGTATEEHDRSGEVTNVDIAVAGADWPELLVNWLAELLFLSQAEDFVPEGV
jgi:SHS2 domain-containing protein